MPVGPSDDTDFATGLVRDVSQWGIVRHPGETLKDAFNGVTNWLGPKGTSAVAALGGLVLGYKMLDILTDKMGLSKGGIMGTVLSLAMLIGAGYIGLEASRASYKYAANNAEGADKDKNDPRTTKHEFSDVADPNQKPPLPSTPTVDVVPLPPALPGRKL